MEDELIAYHGNQKDKTTGKIRTSVNLDRELLAKSKKMGINFSKTFNNLLKKITENPEGKY